tara:strand:+ start:3808 stop:4695 length:888 start_codon:yes stop_codon:yes gene_type:complete
MTSIAVLASESASDAHNKGSTSISQEWMVRVSGATVYLDTTDAFSATGLPAMGGQYLKPGTATLLPYYVLSRTARRRSDTQMAISVTYGPNPRLMPATPSSTNPQNIDPGQPGYCDVQVSSKDVIKDLYRASATLPTPPFNIKTEITDGTATDSGGKPTTFVSRTWEVVVSMTDYPGVLPKLSTINPMIHSRNSVALWGAFGIQYGILMPPRMHRRSGSGLNELQLRWSFDTYYHFLQMSDNDPNTGRPKVEKYPTATDPYHAKPVYWMTDITASADHSTLLTTAQNTLLTSVLS